MGATAAGQNAYIACASGIAEAFQDLENHLDVAWVAGSLATGTACWPWSDIDLRVLLRSWNRESLRALHLSLAGATRGHDIDVGIHVGCTNDTGGLDEVVLAPRIVVDRIFGETQWVLCGDSGLIGGSEHVGRVGAVRALASVRAENRRRGFLRMSGRSSFPEDRKIVRSTMTAIRLGLIASIGSRLPSCKAEMVALTGDLFPDVELACVHRYLDIRSDWLGRTPSDWDDVVDDCVDFVELASRRFLEHARYSLSSAWEQ